MKALVIEEPGKAVIKDVPYPKPGLGEVTVKVSQVGICGTDVHIYKGEFLSPYPIIPGHEFSGIIHEVGEGVPSFQKGQRVAADPSLFCGKCEYCMTNRGNHCENWGALGNTVDGSMAEYVKVPYKNLVVLPEEMSFEEGAFIEPLACVVYAMHRLQMKVGDQVLLFGAGAMGQQLVQSFKAAGASQLVVVDISEEKLQLAKEWGATHVFTSAQLEEARTIQPRGFDIVVDATGIPNVIEEALTFIGPVGKYLQFGVTPTDAKIKMNPFDLYYKDWTLIGSMAINHTFIPAFNWLKEKRIDVSPLVSKSISLEEMPSFLEGPRDKNLLKVQVKIS
ncbi:zinc-dependent alcohol dehydrogenase family protein [Evansella halocellulosilytica]|uniref:zinc-dependent alcohol dehydrogenase family protein n=1 Tax=Evansella halocellulosilytica TaxID=2011013 RepID=UPI000BB7D442|nr:zinc-dependent alcohol dehydrogenase family protein [Evansella halocellulosilytica]